MLGASKSIFGFQPLSAIPGAVLWLDGGDSNTMFQNTAGTTPVTGGGQAVQLWRDKSGNSNNVTGTGTWSGSNMVFNGTTNSFSNTTFQFPNTSYSLFVVFSNTVAGVFNQYIVSGGTPYPLIGVGSNKQIVAGAGTAGGVVFLRSRFNTEWAAVVNYGRPGYLSIDSDDNIFLAGSYTTSFPAPNYFNSYGGVSVTPPSGNNGIIVKYSKFGTILWLTTLRPATGGTVNLLRPSADKSNNVFVAGEYTGNLSLYNADAITFTSLLFTGTLNTNYNFFVAKYSPTGSVAWAARAVGNAVRCGGISTDSVGNVFVGGTYAGATLTLSNAVGTVGASLTYTGTTGSNLFIAKYSSIGEVSWAVRIVPAGVTSVPVFIQLATDSSGNVFATGRYDSRINLAFSNSNGTTGGTLTRVGSLQNTYVAKYDSAGTVAWVTQIGGAGITTAIGIATDTAGNVFPYGGYSAGTAPTLYSADGLTSVTLPAGAFSYLAKYTTTGALVWGSNIVTPGFCIAIGYDNSIYIGGTASSHLGKFSSNGTNLWYARATTSQSCNANGLSIIVGSSGETYTSGNMNNSITNFTGGFYPSDGANDPFSSGVISHSFGTYVVRYSANGFITPRFQIASSNVIVSAVYAPSTMNTFVNGDITNSIVSTTLTTTAVNIGQTTFNGTISEVLIYDTTLSSSQRQAVEGYLASKWGIQSNLIATQPYSIVPPFSRYFAPMDIPGCSLWMDGGDNSTMNSTTAVTIWRDKSGNSNTMTGSGTWSGSNMVFNGSTNAFSNLGYVFPHTAYSLFAVYSNTVAPAASQYMNVMYGSNGFPMLGTFDVGRSVTARSVVANTGALRITTAEGWAAQIAGTTTSSDFGRGTTTDLSGNIFVTGSYSAAASLYNAGGTVVGATLLYTGVNDVFITKYSRFGTVSWAAQIAGAGNDIGYGVATDSVGDVFVTGQYGDALTLYSTNRISSNTLPFTGGNADVFIAKYSSTGTILWAAQIGGGGDDRPHGIATDTSGNVFVTGRYGAALTLYSTNRTSSNTLPFTGGIDCFVAKYSSAGTILWAAQITGTTTSQDIGYGIAADPSGNVFVTGQYRAALTLYSVNRTSSNTLLFTGGVDTFIAKYSSTGTILWAAQITGTTTSQDIGYGIATDTSGNVFVTGQYSVGTLTLYSVNRTSSNTLLFTGGVDTFIAKYSSTGTILWAAQIASTSSDVAQGIATDPSGNVVVTGYYSGALTLYSTGRTSSNTLPFTGGFDVFVAKYSSAGTILWAAQIAGTGNDFGQGIATDPSGNVVVTGYYGAAVTLFNTGGTTGATLPFTGGTDVFIAKYNPDGFITPPIPASSNVLIDATYLPSTMTPFINGFATTTTLAGTTLATTGIFLGGPSNYFNGSLSELLIYSSTLTSNQRQQVEGYLAAKWGLRSQIISTHPYLTILPSAPTPAPYYQTNSLDWISYWQPYLNSLALGNSSGVTLSTSNLTGGAVYTSTGWQGAVLGADGNMYCVPYLASNVLNLNIKTASTINIMGASAYNLAGGWAGGVLGPDSNIYFAPTSLAGIKRLSTVDGVTTNITGGATYLSNGWQGGVIGPDGNMYCCPSNAANIVRLIISTGVTSNITGGATYTSSGWSGGVLGPDGNMYCAPYSANNILKLTISTGVTSNITGGATYTAQGWYGGVLGPDGNIYFAPYSANNILKLDVATGITTNITGGGTYVAAGWRGAVIGPDGNMYCVPAAASSILRLNISTGLTTNITGGATFTANGWAGGVLGPDGNIYFAPYSANNILKLTFTGLSQLPSSNYVLSAYANKL
jgi:hypothetical protein